MPQNSTVPKILIVGGGYAGFYTAWKLETMRAWGDVSRAAGCVYHVARVNSARRIARAQEAGADSFDGTSASRYAQELPGPDRAVRQGGFRW